MNSTPFVGGLKGNNTASLDLPEGPLLRVLQLVLPLKPERRIGMIKNGHANES